MAEHPPDGPDTLRIPFVFVRHGDPPPLEWMARHPSWVKSPAVMIPRNAPAHPANGGPYPTFSAPPPAPKMAPLADPEHWPFGRPVSAGLQGAMSRLRPGGVPPRYPGGHGAPVGMFPSMQNDPVAVYLRVNAVLDRAMGRTAAVPQENRRGTDDSVAELRNSAGGSGNNHPIKVAQSALPLLLPQPELPPVFIPGTKENDDFTKSVEDAARTIGHATGRFFKNDPPSEDPPQLRPAVPQSVRGLPPKSTVPPVKNPEALVVGPASRPSEAAEGGQSI